MNRIFYRRSLELLIVVAIITVVTRHFKAKVQTDIAQPRGRDIAAQTEAENLWKEVVTKSKDALESWPRNVLETKLRVANDQLKSEPNNIEWLRARAEIYADMGELELSLQDLAMISRLDPYDHFALYFHSLHSAELGAYDVAVADLVKLEHLFENPIPGSILNEHAYYLAKAGRFDEALSVANRADSTEPEDADILQTLGYIYVGLGDNQAALEKYDRAIALDPSLLGALRGRAAAHHRLGHRELSQADLAACAKIDPEFCVHWALEDDPGAHKAKSSL